MMTFTEVTAELSGWQNLPPRWAMSPVLGCEQGRRGGMCAAGWGRPLNASLPSEGEQGFQRVWESTSFKKTSSCLKWGEKLIICSGVMSPQCDYVAELPATLGGIQIPKHLPGLTESESPSFSYSPTREWGSRNLNTFTPQIILTRWLTKLWEHSSTGQPWITALATVRGGL